MRPSSCVTPTGTSNELDVQHEWEENTHAHVYKGYKHSTHCAMVHAQYEYKEGKYRYIARAGHARTLYKRYKRSTHCALGTTAVRVQTRANRYIARAGHANSLYKGYTHSTHCAMVHAQYEYKHG